MNLRYRRAIAPMLRAAAPRHSACQHCGWPWSRVVPRSVTYEERETSSSGIFFVCTDCWPLLTAAEAIKYACRTVLGYGPAGMRHTAWDQSTGVTAVLAVAKEMGASQVEESHLPL